GIRMDTVKNVGLPYWTAWTAAMRRVKPDLFLLGEVYDEGPPDHLAPYVDAGFDSVFNYPLFAALRATFTGGSVEPMADAVNEQIRVLGLPRVARLVTFVDNHDNARFPSVLAGETPEEEIAERHRLALGAIFTLPGIPQLYYGDELALYGG